MTQRATIMERSGPFYFPPVTALITSGGRLLLSTLQKMVAENRRSILDELRRYSEVQEFKIY